MHSNKRSAMRALVGAAGVAATVSLLNSCAPSVASTPLSCDDSIRTHFKPDAQTTVLAVKAFKAGDPLVLSEAVTSTTPKASSDLCMIKLSVGPGNPGPANAPSTSAGIGIEIFLPAKADWNDRLHISGGSGWAGGNQASTTMIGVTETAMVAGAEGAVSASTDAGHANQQNGGSFLMNPDGSISLRQWADFSSRGIHEMVVKTKALATAYYGVAPKYSYYDGTSTGGRQGLKLAQINPADFDGILTGMPAINWSRFITAELYPWIVFMRDLGGVPLTREQQDLASNAAIRSCDVVGGVHLGYIMDPASCKYDPTTDRTVLCTSSGGINATKACISTAQATALNKIWYGQTADGSVPSPSVDNGWNAAAVDAQPSGVHRWFGLTRGTSLYGREYEWLPLNGLAHPNGPFPIAADQVALQLQNPAVSEPGFVNATGNGQQQWKSLTYAGLSAAFDQGVALQTPFSGIDSDDPDLVAFKARGEKLLHYHGLADELIPPQGSVNYYSRVVDKIGSLADTQAFYRLYLIPGMGHLMKFDEPKIPSLLSGGNPANGTSNTAANPPLPAGNQLYEVLTDWVEKGIAPGPIEIRTLSGAPRSQPICMYPTKATYKGSDDVNVSDSYTCS